MIGLSRLKRAIGDVPTSGMQTGDPKVRLKLCDAQRLEVEFNAIIAERDAALAREAELVAQVEALNKKNFELTCYRIDVIRCLKTIAFEHNHDDFPLYQPLARQLMDSISANTELVEVRAEAGRAGFLAGSQTFGFNLKRLDELADSYADRVKAGEV